MARRPTPTAVAPTARARAASTPLRTPPVAITGTPALRASSTAATVGTPQSANAAPSRAPRRSPTASARAASMRANDVPPAPPTSSPATPWWTRARASSPVMPAPVSLAITGTGERSTSSAMAGPRALVTRSPSVWMSSWTTLRCTVRASAPTMSTTRATSSAPSGAASPWATSWQAPMLPSTSADGARRRTAAKVEASSGATRAARWLPTPTARPSTSAASPSVALSSPASGWPPVMGTSTSGAARRWPSSSVVRSTSSGDTSGRAAGTSRTSSHPASVLDCERSETASSRWSRLRSLMRATWSATAPEGTVAAAGAVGGVTPSRYRRPTPGPPPDQRASQAAGVSSSDRTWSGRRPSTTSASVTSSSTWRRAARTATHTSWRAPVPSG